jgi:signal transduction histidine kinase
VRFRPFGSLNTSRVAHPTTQFWLRGFCDRHGASHGEVQRLRARNRQAARRVSTRRNQLARRFQLRPVWSSHWCDWNYWAKQRLPAVGEVELLMALANTTSTAIENVRAYSDLEQRVQTRTAQLAAANQELRAFAHAVSHEFGAPLRAIRAFSELSLAECSGELRENGRMYATKVHAGAKQMREIMDDLLRLSRNRDVDAKRQSFRAGPGYHARTCRRRAGPGC